LPKGSFGWLLKPIFAGFHQCGMGGAASFSDQIGGTPPIWRRAMLKTRSDQMP
jgi:hypothetical protein